MLLCIRAVKLALALLPGCEKDLGLSWERISIVSPRTTSEGESARDFSRNEE